MGTTTAGISVTSQAARVRLTLSLHVLTTEDAFQSRGNVTARKIVETAVTN